MRKTPDFEQILQEYAQTVAKSFRDLEKRIEVFEDPLGEKEEKWSIADEKWEFVTIDGEYSVRSCVPGTSPIAIDIPSKRYANAIAALPDLVKASRETLKRIHRMGKLSMVKSNLVNVSVELKEALEKAGEC